MDNIDIIQADITTLDVDAIVNAANQSLLGGGGVDGAIHQAEGPKLLAECQTLNGCKTGDAKITLGYRLPARYVIHTVGPIWHGGAHNEPQLLAACYQNSLALAYAHKLSSIAFPDISCGVYGYPVDQACDIAVREIMNFKPEHLIQVILCSFSARMKQQLNQALSHYPSRVHHDG